MCKKYQLPEVNGQSVSISNSVDSLLTLHFKEAVVF